MNFMPATVEGDHVKLPVGDVKIPQELRERVGRAEGKPLLAGIRPESFEDASLVGEAADRGSTFTAKIEVLEAMGSDSTPTSRPTPAASRSSPRSSRSWRRTRGRATSPQPAPRA